MNKITSFKGYYFFLSNFYTVNIVYDQLTYPSVEHAYQAAKTLDLGYRELIQRASTAGKAKQIGKVVPIRDNWELIKIAVMRNLVRQKFQDEQLNSRLQNTSPAVLEEGNYWGDTFWGVDLDGNGSNWLGKILMEIRDV